MIMALAVQEKASLSTFSVGFFEKAFDESPHAREVARHLGTDHHELRVTQGDLVRALPRLVWQYGQPFGDSSCIPSHIVSQLARQHETVSLSGDGGDELFGGYRRARICPQIDRYRRCVPEAIQANIVPLISDETRYQGWRGSLARLNAMSIHGPLVGRTNALGWALELDELLGKGPFACGANRSENFPKGEEKKGLRSLTTLQQVLYDDIKNQLAADFLVKIDVASMATSLEVRAPFLDHALAEWAWSLPDRFKVYQGETKYILKMVAERHLPRSIIYRRKQGFALPLSAWWRQDLGGLLANLLEDTPLELLGWLDLPPVRRALQEHLSGKQDHAMRLWWMLWLDLWCRMFVEGSLKPDDDLLPLCNFRTRGVRLQHA